jgi:hypothetical protein
LLIWFYRHSNNALAHCQERDCFWHFTFGDVNNDPHPALAVDFDGRVDWRKTAEKGYWVSHNFPHTLTHADAHHAGVAGGKMLACLGVKQNAPLPMRCL